MFDTQRPQRIDNGLGYRGRRRYRAGLAHALDAERIGGAGHFHIAHVEGGHVIGARHGVIRKAPGKQLPAIALVNDLSHEPLANALRQSAVNLSFADHRVDDHAQVVHHRVALDAHHAGLGIDLHFTGVAAIGIVGGFGRPGPARRS